MGETRQTNVFAQSWWISPALPNSRLGKPGSFFKAGPLSSAGHRSGAECYYSLRTSVKRKWGVASREQPIASRGREESILLLPIPYWLLSTRFFTLPCPLPATQSYSLRAVQIGSGQEPALRTGGRLSMLKVGISKWLCAAAVGLTIIAFSPQVSFAVRRR